MGRRASGSIGVNLDSLLDTLTNVVGFLVILLVLMNLDAQDSIDRIRAAHPEAFGVRPEDVTRSRQELTELEKRRLALTADAAAAQTKVDELKPSIGAAPAGAAPGTKPEDPKKLADQLVALEKKFSDQDKEAARLQAMLEQTPLRSAPPPSVLVLPDPKPAPTNAEAVYFFCHHGRIVPMDLEALRKTAADNVERNSRTLMYRDPASRAQPSKSKDPVKYDPQKVNDYFKRMKIGDLSFSVQVSASDTRTWAQLIVEPRERAGETLAQLQSGRSAAAALLRRASAQKNYIRFLVAPDSYDVYLAAREIADRLNLPAGWEALGSARWSSSVPGISIEAKNLPPPAPKPATTTPAPKPPPPRVLD